MKNKIVSNLFWNNGLQIINQKKKNIKIDKKLIEKYFKTYGFILFRNFNFKPDNIKFFSDMFTRIYANDAARREKTNYDNYVNGVDEGYGRMSLHSEASFSPSWPEILWFYCLKPSKKFGETTFCDGIKLWDSLSLNSKNFFLKYPMNFKLKIPVMSPKTNMAIKNWQLNKLGTSNSKLNYKDGFLYTEQTRFAVSETYILNKLSFANHFLYEDTDPTILDWGFLGYKSFPNKIKKEVKQISDKLTYYHKWKSNDLIMIDNRRFLHGRNKILRSDPKKIFNIQTLTSNINKNYIN